MSHCETDFSLNTYLSKGQKQIDEALEGFLPKPVGKFKTLIEALRYSLFAGGKRVRPILALASYEVFALSNPLNNKELEIILPSASALELIHTYSLIHDDLPCMDNDDFRRGKPTSHKVFGEDMAVLAGDGLLTLAFELIAKTPHTDPKILIQVIQILSESSGTFGLIGGQVLDLESEGKKLSPSQLQDIHENKTGALISSSVKIGAILGQANEEQLKRIDLFGQSVGLAFQIVDDILDVESTTEKLGKTVKKDLVQEKATYPSVFGLEKSKKMASDLRDQAIDSLQLFGDKAQALRELASFIIDRKK